MARKHYKNQNLIQLFTILGGLIGLAMIILSFVNIENYAIYEGIAEAGDVITTIIIRIVGLIICVITILAGLKPNDPVPLHWLVLFILAILLIIFGAGIWACILVIIAGLIGLIEDIS